MKVLVLTPSWRRVGPVLGALALAKHLHEHGTQTVFAALHGGGTEDHVTAPASVRWLAEATDLPLHDFDMPRWLGLRHVGRISRYVRERGIDVVVSYTARPDVANSLLTGAVRVASNREMWAPQWRLNYGWWRSRVGMWAHLRALKRLDGVFVLTEAMGAHLIETGIDPSKICKVNNFVDVAAVRESLANISPQADEYIHIGYFGNLTRRKRVDVAIRAISALVRDHAHPSVKLHVVGDGPLRGTLVRLAEELRVSRDVVFHGFLEDPLVLMAEMHIVVLPSEMEGMSRSLLEAMALGRTCVSSSVPGVEELIQHGKTGYLTPFGDASALASTIDTIIRTGGYIAPSHLHRYMLANYDADVCAGQMLDHLQRLVGSTRT